MDRKNQKVLMIARSFPPFRSVGGSIRIVKFIKYLPSLDWNPVVLTIDDRFEYETWRRMGSESLLPDIPQDINIYRIPAAERTLNSIEKEMEFVERHRVLGGLVKVINSARKWFLRTFLLPDRYIRWLPIALRRALRIIKEEEIDIIFTTSPSFSVSIVGAVLKRLSGLSLIVDFRDDWIDTPGFKEKTSISQWVERKLEKFVIHTADKVTLVTEWSMNAFIQRHSDEPKNKFVFIPNGCDLEDFEGHSGTLGFQAKGLFTIVHAGILNDSDSWTRRPTPIFQALERVIQEHPELAAQIKLVFTGKLTENFRQVIREMGLLGLVDELGHLSKDEYVRLLRRADILLAINYQGFETLIPGKIYEYWAAGNAPILLLSCHGAAQSLIEKHRLGFSVLPEDVETIKKVILDLYGARQNGIPVSISSDGIGDYSRRSLSSKLAQTFSAVKAGISMKPLPANSSTMRNLK